MSDNEDEAGKPFCIERAKQGRANCKKCKQKCLAGEFRLAKIAANPFGSGKMKQWHHVKCLLEQFLTQRATTKRIEHIDDIDGWDALTEDEQKDILTQINENAKNIADKHGTKFTPIKYKPAVDKTTSPTKSKKNKGTEDEKNHRDNLFREFRRLVAAVTNENSYLEKSAIIKNMFTKGSDGSGFKGDIIQWCRLLLPGVIKRIYNLQSKQLVNLFSGMFQKNRDKMLEHLEQGDIGETIQHFFENNSKIKPNKKSLLTLQDVDDFLEELTKRTRDQEYADHFQSILPKCTANDLKIIIRLVKHDLRMNAGAKHVLDAVHSDAYAAFQSSRDINLVLKRILDSQEMISNDKVVKASIQVMTPILPMLAEACKSVEQAMKKCPNGMYSEIKYDGERVQVHKHGADFKYYSRSLKPVMPYKVSHFQKYIPQAFPHANDLILDSEILLIDTVDGKPLPFGSLGKHKKEKFKNANVCLFVFDCIYYNGDSLIHKPIKERRRVLKENMIEIQNHIMFSEMEIVHKATDLAAMITKVLRLGLEGLVLKDILSIYEPGKRHWLKVKKDYLNDGAMADTADLIVLGAWFGTGKKGGMMSVFLMGCYDKYSDTFRTVTKVHTGHDDKTLEKLQSELDMIKITTTKVPDWLDCTRTMIPDFVARDPKKQPVWEVTGAEFTQHDVHTADGISIRFPRVTRMRYDKNWETATNLQELNVLVKNSKEKTDFDIIVKTEDDCEDTKDVEVAQIKTEIKDDDEVEVNLNKKRTSTQLSKSKKMKVETAVIKIEKTDVVMYPEIFNNVKLLTVEQITVNSNDLIRYFIGYGGDFLDSQHWELATHVVHDKSIICDLPVNCPQAARHVTVDWIKDSIGNGFMQDTRPYAVQWFPQ